MDINCYAQRLFNPFRGIMNVIAYAGAEAVSLDGLHWDIYVRDTELVSDLQNNRRILSSDLRYGRWSEKEGLVRGPIYPSDDFKRLEAEGDIVFHYLLQHHQDVPFAFADHYELWLLDIMRQPLAILNSVVYEEDMELDGPLQWRVGVKCEQDFSSPSFESLHKPRYNAGEYISHYVNQCARPEPCAQWFYRHQDGSGSGLEGVNLHSRYRQRQLDSRAFPKYFLNDLSHDPQHSQLLDDYLKWQAPYFLLLQNLSSHRRDIIEKQACKRALLMDELCHLYPDVVNADLLNAARVEAVLRRNVLSAKAQNDEGEIYPARGTP